MLDVVDRFPLYPLILTFVFYPVLAWILLKLAPSSIRIQFFTILNVAGLAAMCWLSGASGVRLKEASAYSKVALLFFSAYFGFALLNYAVLRQCRRGGTIWPTAASLLPIFLLAYVKYAPDSMSPFGAVLATAGVSRFAVFFVGISYLSFRLVHLVQEVRNSVVKMPTVWEYLCFAFFLPTLSVGPINPYSKFIASIGNTGPEIISAGRSWLRILIGFTKYIFLGSLVAQFTYAGLLRDGHPHAAIDLIVAVPAYTIYLYCNFSGFCDMVIGISGLLGIKVAENFDRPFQTRNLQEFWTHWHMTLSTWIRDLLFTPMTKSLMRKFGPESANHVIAASLFISFFVVGIWHGTGLNFVIFGVLQGIGLAAVHYYTVWLKRRLGRERFALYRQNKVISSIASVITFVYFSLTLFVFANTWKDMLDIKSSLK
jgi:D-alanyl-lipoteichoic acid acyltransferase DltB (MBOAT superfamily)